MSLVEVCGYPMSVDNSINNDKFEVKIKDGIFYVDKELLDIIKADHEKVIEKKLGPKVNLKDKITLGTTILKIHNKRLKDQELKEENLFYQKVNPILEKSCKILDPNTQKKISKEIFQRCLKQKEFEHSFGCAGGEICYFNNSDDLLMPNKNNGFSFDANGKSFRCNGKNQEGYIAFTDHKKTNLFIRPAAEFAHGAKKRLFDVASLPLNDEKNNNASEAIISCAEKLAFSETEFLNDIDCEYIISAPKYLGLVQVSNNSYPEYTYEYLTAKADGTLNTKFVNEQKLNDIQILTYALHIAKGLQYLHEEKKLVHSDIKGDNILIFDNIAKIADLGSSAEQKFDTAHEGSTIRSPELCHQGGPKFKGYAHDMYCLGYTLFTFISPGNKAPDMIGMEESPSDYEKRLFADFPERDDPAKIVIKELILQLLISDPAKRISAKDTVAFIKENLAK